jgi:hypothetical protein
MREAKRARRREAIGLPSGGGKGAIGLVKKALQEVNILNLELSSSSVLIIV